MCFSKVSHFYKKMCSMMSSYIRFFEIITLDLMTNVVVYQRQEANEKSYYLIINGFRHKYFPINYTIAYIKFLIYYYIFFTKISTNLNALQR